MKLNLDEIKLKIQSGTDALVDGGYLEDDMKALYEYYQSEDVFNPPKIRDYKLTHESFELKSFSECYLGMILKCEINLIETEDGWIRIIPE